MTLYFRTDLSSFIEATYPATFIIGSTAELADYYERNKDTYQFQHGHYGGTSMADDVFGGGRGFDDDFFIGNSLLLVILEEGSGSIRHRVESVLPQNGVLLVRIIRTIPEIGTADMAQWHIALALEKTMAGLDVEIALLDEYIADC